MKNKVFTYLILLITSITFSQESDAYSIWKNRLVLHSSLGYQTAPFSIKYNYPDNIKKLKYKANMNPVLSFGFAYKWAAFKIGFKLPGYIRNTTDFGKTNYFDLNLEFGVKSWYFDIDLHTYRGYSLLNIDKLNEDLSSPNTDNRLRPNTNAASFSVNAWKFFNKEYKVKPAIGIVGRYKKQCRTWYLKSTINLHGIADENQILPWQYIDSTTSILRSQNMSALDFGAVPGYAIVDNKNGWQYGAWVGLGVVVQAKFWTLNENSRGFLGLAPRIDLKIKGGYNVDNWFVMLLAEFDNKSIRFNDLKYRQLYYSLKITSGYRFKEKTKKKPRN